MKNALDIQDAIYRMFNTDDGLTVLNHLMDNFVYASPYANGVNEIGLAYATGKADIIRNFYLISKSKGNK